MKGSVCFCLAVLSLPLGAQTRGNVITAVGYAPPRPVRVAPGQVVTLFLRAGNIQLDAPVSSTSLPLPLSLAGFSVGMKQTFSDGNSLPVPVIAVAPVQNCSAVVPPVCARGVALTIQIPYELFPNIENSRLPQNFATLVVSENGVEGDPVPLEAVPDRIHILNSCDSTEPPSGICLPAIFHPDGTAVTLQSPAHAGERLSLQSYGLGRPVSLPVTGAASPALALSVPGTKVYFRFGADTRPARSGTPADPDSSILAPGSIGVYQVNFLVPPLPDGLAGCTLDTPSNLTVSIGRGSSFDGAGICVQ
jgi:uncharacterized protein (TIGR03437 family)